MGDSLSLGLYHLSCSALKTNDTVFVRATKRELFGSLFYYVE